MRSYAVRPCCQTNYNVDHRGDCFIRGWAARAKLPCDITVDGWCAAHSTGAGPIYCTPASTNGDQS